ncbi:MAG: carboxypeptidase regulatory-like domain-containing protein, partial [Thermoguttaceae bacterium]
MNTQIMLSRILQAIVDAPVWCLLLLKITAILALAWVLHLALFRANPRWRVLSWRMTAAGLIALPAIVWLFPAMQIRFSPSPENEITANLGDASQNIALTNPPLAEPLKFNPAGEPGKRLLRPGSKQFAYDPGGMDAIDPSRSGAPQFTPPRHGTYPISLQNMLMAVWLGGVFIFAMRACIGHYRIWQIARRAEQSPESLRNECGRVAHSIGCATPVKIAQSEKIRSPLLCGLWRSLLLLPKRMCEDSYRGDLPGIFAHELTHVRCHDLFWNAGLHIISILLWFHPLAWRLRKAHLTACELVCDAVSAGFVGDVSEYCRTLARVAVDVFTSHPAAGIAMARLSTISRRLEELKKGILSMPLHRGRVIGFAFVAILAVSLLGTIRFALAESDTEKTQRAEIKLRIVEVPRQSNLAKQLPNGGVIINEQELRKLIDDAQDDKRANVLQSPRIQTPIGVRAFVSVPWGNWTLVCQVVPEASTDKNAIALRIKPDLVKQGQVSAITAAPESWHWRTSINAELKRDEAVAFGGWDDARGETRGNDHVTIIVLQAGYVGHAAESTTILNSPPASARPHKTVDNTELNQSEKETTPAKNAAASSKTASMQVRLVDEDGKPIPGAKLNAWDGNNKNTFTADAEGKAVIEGSTSYIKNLRLDIHAEGHVPVTWWSRTKETTPPRELNFTMENAQTVGGVVQDEQGKPIKGVNVKLLRPFDQGYVYLDPPSQTDSEGRWTYNYAPKDLNDINIVLEHPEFVEQGLIRPSALEIEKMAKQTSVMVMKKGVAVTGTVTDPDGKPVANALVAQGRDRFSSIGTYTTRTDKDGHYRITLVDPRNYILTVISPGLAPDLRNIDVKDRMPPVDFSLEKGGVIRIRVIDKDGKPVEGVHMAPDTWRGYRTLTDAGIAGKTDKDGRWSWTWAPKQPVEMSIYKSGYMSLRNYPLAPQEDEQVVKLNPPLAISGNVIDAKTKQPIPSFSVVQGSIPKGGDEQMIFWSRDILNKGENGRYNLVIDEPAIARFVRIEADGYTPEVSRGVKSDEGKVTCDFSLNKGEILNVAVRLPDEKPAAGADVHMALVPEGRHVNMAEFIKNGRFSLPTSSKISLKVNADGQLTIEPQDSEYLVIVIHDQGYAQTTSKELIANP